MADEPENENAEEQPAAEEQPPEEQAAPEQPEAAAEPPAPEPEPAEPAAEEAAEEAERASDAPAAPADAGGGSDLPPGADLDPIALEPEAELSAEERARLEAEAEERAQREAAMAEDEVVATSRTPAEIRADGRYLATGKRKSAIARVTLVSGSGGFQINGRELGEYFPRPLHQTMARQPLTATGYEENVDVRVRVHGGGVGGQAAAVRHGIARALTEIDSELRGDLKRRGFLTRDPRVKERKKAGLKKARKRPQFSKR
jgi:small subunit ribosomal protein S9